MAVILFFFSHSLWADLVYLKDGTLLENVKILSADNVQTKVEQNGKVSVYPQAQILRLRYNMDTVEKVNILMQSGEIKRAYVIEQDPDRILVRYERNSNKEVHIFKDDIKQISRKEIVLLYPSLSFRTGYYMAGSTGNSGISGGFGIYAGMGLRLPFVSSSRLVAEIGFVEAKSSDSEERNLQIIPLFTTYNYWYTLSRSFYFTPRIGFSGALVTFNDGEGESFQGLTIGGLAGLGFTYEVLPGSTYLSLFADYFLLYDGTEAMNNISFSMGIAYRY